MVGYGPLCGWICDPFSLAQRHDNARCRYSPLRFYTIDGNDVYSVVPCEEWPSASDNSQK